MSQACSLRCKSAHPESECNCSCEGQFHGEWFGGSVWANKVEKKEDKDGSRSENESDR